VNPGDHTNASGPDEVSGTDLAVLAALVKHQGRVVGRSTLLRDAQLSHCTERRCDSAIVSLRRVLGADSIITVRRRGWMLSPAGVLTAESLLESTPLAS
jgi:DNA-binding response OmpR family regulator